MDLVDEMGYFDGVSGFNSFFWKARKFRDNKWRVVSIEGKVFLELGLYNDFCPRINGVPVRLDDAVFLSWDDYVEKIAGDDL